MNPILFEFPDEFTTKRLLIRAPKPGDGKVVHTAIEASRNDLKPWLPFAHNQQTAEETEINIRNAQLAFLKREDLRLLVFHRETGEYIASSGLHRIDWNVRKFEIGYWIDSRHSGKGYITEAVDGITAFAFNQLNARRVEIRCDEKNLKSRAVPEKLGYHLEGILINDDLSPETKELRNTCIYAKIRKLGCHQAFR